MRFWGRPEEFMASSDVKTLVSYVEARGYYTEAEKRALVAMAECGMPPWEAAKRLARWVWSEFDSPQIHESVTTAVRVWRSNHRQQEPASGGWMGGSGSERERMAAAWEQMVREAERAQQAGWR